MTVRVVRTALAILFALATLRPMAAQITSTSQPTSLNFTAQGRVGIEQDGSMSTTILWIFNTWAGDWNASSVRLFDADGNPFQVSFSPVSGATYPNAAAFRGGPFGNAAQRFVLSGNHGTAAAQNFTIQLQSAGFAISATVLHFDANGHLLGQPSNSTDLALLTPGVGTQYAVGLDVETGLDTSLVFNNPSSLFANVTLQAYSDEGISSPGRTPFATVQVLVPPQGKVSRLVSELFANSTDFANFLASDGGNILQGYLSVTSDQGVAVSVVQEMIAPDGSMNSVVWQAFPSAPPAPTNQ